MNGRPMDMFDEMDEMFSRLFSRMDREMMAGLPQGFRYDIIMRHNDEEGASLEMADNATSIPRETGEPVTEVHCIGKEVKVITGLPGITDEELRLSVKGNTLLIDAGDADHHYRTSADLPPVDPASMQKTLKNGVLEVTFASLLDASEKS